MRLRSLLSALVSSFIDGVDRLQNDEVAAHRASLADVVASAFDSLYLDFQSILEVCSADEGGVDCLQLTEGCQERFVLCLWCLVTIDVQVDNACSLSTSRVFSIKIGITFVRSLVY